MLNPHECLGIAQAIFYVPVVPSAVWLMARNGRVRPRLAWWPLIPFSLMRLAGGPVIIALERNPQSVGLFVAAVILLNVGVIPLVVATLGFVRVVLLDNYRSNPWANKLGRLIRFAIVVAIALLAAGGGVSSIGTKSAMDTSRTLTLAGYIVFAAILVLLISMQLYFWKRRRTLLPSSQTVLRGGLLASPFLIIRTVFGFLEVALENSAASPFNPVMGSAVGFALMALLPEYLVVAIYLHVGFSIAPDRGASAATNGQTAAELGESADQNKV